MDSKASSPSRRSLRDLAPGSIVARTTLAIIVLSLLVGLVFGGAAAGLIQHNETERQQKRLNELLATVESTISIACFVGDTALAREIGEGLMSNHIVSGVYIATTTATLYRQSRSGDADTGETLAISRKVASPFDAGEIVGEVRIQAATADIQAEAWAYTRFIVLVLALEVALVAASVAWVVFNLITRPIKGISDELHRLEVRTGVHLQVPLGNRQDEIGRLVSDVNALIGELTQLLDTERTLRLEREASERRLALIFEKVDAGIFEIDAEGGLRSWNPSFLRTLGELPDPPSLKTMLGRHASRLEELIRSSLASGTLREEDFELEGSDGGKWVELSLTPVGDDLLQGVINDISERKNTELAAQRLAARDTLTGLLNRRGFDLGLAAAFEQKRQNPQLAIAVMLIDLDYFKQVNDTYGHAAGDITLRFAAATLEATVRRSDLVARSGGDEFSVILIDIDSPERASAIADAIIAALRQPIDIGDGVQVRIGASIGVAMVKTSGDSPAAVLRRADEAMYVAKGAGRCQARFASPD